MYCLTLTVNFLTFPVESSVLVLHIAVTVEVDKVTACFTGTVGDGRGGGGGGNFEGLVFFGKFIFTTSMQKSFLYAR